MKIADIFSRGHHDGDCDHGAIPATEVTEATLVMNELQPLLQQLQLLWLEAPGSEVDS